MIVGRERLFSEKAEVLVEQENSVGGWRQKGRRRGV
jgi:hypothetical protein